MVVLEEGGMLTTGHNQYLQPDYLSPLPTTLDAKKSPLALLAQTCSQIGADSPTKPLISPLDKTSKGMNTGTNAKSPPAAKLERSTRSSPSDGKSLAFKPYETNVVSKKSSSDESRPASKASVHSVSGQESCGGVSASDSGNHAEKKSSGNRTPVGRKSASPASQATATSSTTPSIIDRKTPADREKTDGSPRTSSNNNNGTSPIIRSGMEILSGGHAKDSSNLAAYKPGTLAGFSGNPLCCPPGLAENPAFRPPFAGASPFSHHHAAAAALLGYPSSTPTGGNPYLSYARVKTPAGGEALVPVCKDPYCTGCQYSMHSAQLMMGTGTCPSGCTQCDHQKYGLAMALSSFGPMAPPSLSYPSTLTGGRPYVCNWIAGDSYCGKRFTTSDELLQHLRSHTSLAGGDHAAAAASSSAALLANPHPHPLLSPSAALHRASAAAAAAATYPTPSLSPLGARYHPYGKPPTGPLPASLAASPYSAFNALGPYYSPYAIYGQRIGAAVHP
ncbi:zinc finger protein Noc isoform X1 [Apis florea]|uniref:zinc finger protein Noc isoform X1 n=1 Tax=Apis florea TaxID=7463 RepID=UPI000629C4F4|nr:zinc finger protein Noc isoform X1 [Apis florea]